MIGDDIELTVLAVQGEKVRLGIQAPSDVAVHRTEIYLEIGHEREQPSRRPDAGSGAQDAPPGGESSREQP